MHTCLTATAMSRTALLIFTLMICGFTNNNCITNKQLAQLPQYAVGPMINVHPFITHVYIAVPDAAVRGAMDTILCTSAALDFVRDNDIYTDWKVTTATDFHIYCLYNIQCTHSIQRSISSISRPYTFDRSLHMNSSRVNNVCCILSVHASAYIHTQ
jgi:hypothetical protein